jgi:2-haloalkanoic acid dehalogenase type II
MRIKALFLDFYGTLVHEDDEIVRKMCERICNESPCRPETGEIKNYWWELFSSSCASSFGDGFMLQRDIELKSLEAVLRRFEYCGGAGGLSEELFRYWARPSLFDDTLHFLNTIDIPVCIVSNIDRKDLYSAVEFNNIKAESLLTSEDVRSYKPRPEIFLKALELMKVRPEEALHVGDSLACDIAGAGRLGINTCWLNRSGRYNSGGGRPDMECPNLACLCEYLT